MDQLDQVGEQIIAAVGRGGAAELLGAITRPVADRAALIGQKKLEWSTEGLSNVLSRMQADN
jgi:hypothetical protein